MPYNKTTWVDRVVQFPNRYKDQNLNQYTFTPDAGTVTASGTPINAGNLNKIEDELENLDLNKSDKSDIANAMLVSANWVGTQAPYTYTLTVNGATDTNVIEVIPQSTITLAQALALSKAVIITGTQSANSITLKAIGIKPTIDIPITTIVRGDM